MSSPSISDSTIKRANSSSLLHQGSLVSEREDSATLTAKKRIGDVARGIPQEEEFRAGAAIGIRLVALLLDRVDCPGRYSLQ
jgi:hypothetical protein